MKTFNINICFAQKGTWNTRPKEKFKTQHCERFANRIILLIFCFYFRLRWRFWTLPCFYKAEKRIGLLFDSFQSDKLLFDFQHFQCYLMRCGKRANAALIAAFSFNGNGLAWVGVQPSWQRAVATLKQTKIKIKISKSLFVAHVTQVWSEHLKGCFGPNNLRNRISIRYLFRNC